MPQQISEAYVKYSADISALVSAHKVAYQSTLDLQKRIDSTSRNINRSLINARNNARPIKMDVTSNTSGFLSGLREAVSAGSRAAKDFDYDGLIEEINIEHKDKLISERGWIIETGIQIDVKE
jgi:hypothetical protein